MPTAVLSFIIALALLAAPSGPALPAPQSPLRLGVAGSQFTINAAARFLVFISMFDALDASPANLAADFKQLKAAGIDGVRIFPNWWAQQAPGSAPKFYSNATLFDAAGHLRPSRLQRLREVLRAARVAGLVVDLSLSAESVGDCPASNCPALKPDIGALTKAEFSAAVVALARALSDDRDAHAHVLLDLQNEANLRGPVGGALTPDEWREVVRAVRAVDPSRVVTVSTSGDISATAAATFATDTALDVATWHESREKAWWMRTAAWLGEMKKISARPVYLQEPEPFGDGSWTIEGIVANVRAARDAGAAAWCFHTRAGFHLDKSSMWSELAPPEREALRRLRPLLTAAAPAPAAR